MTDASLPTHQSDDQHSYVDSYSPPSQVNQNDVTAASPASSGNPTTSPTQNSPVSPSSQPVANGATSATDDPLAELEKALKEYQERQAKATKLPDVGVDELSAEAKTGSSQTSSQSVASQPKPSPSAGSPKSPNQSKSISQSKSAADAGNDPLAELERVLDEYEARYRERQRDELPKESESSQKEPSAAEPPAAKPSVTDSSPTEPSPTSSPQKTPAMESPTVRTFPKEDEAIEAQNIFALLGVEKAEEKEKEAFLDELQQALWDDFLEKDLPLLVSDKEFQTVQDLQKQPNLAEDKLQEQLIHRVEELVPDVEEIMLEKALGLKEEMVWERVAGMKTHFAQQSEKLAKIKEAEEQLTTGHWKTGTDTLNSLAT